MKKLLLVISIFLIWGATYLKAQTLLEKDTERIGVNLNLPSFLEASKNTDLIYVAEISESNPVPGIEQLYGPKHSFGDTYFNVLFGMVHSILTYKKDECVVFVYISSGGGSKYGEIIKDSSKLYTIKNIGLERIKHDFKYGKPYNAPSELEADELYSMLTHYPNDKAKRMFNANAMVSYPLNLRGNAYNRKYTRGRAVVLGKGQRQIYLYFMMTDESVLRFESFLEDFDKVFYFKD